jgi:two-component system, cell cycle response regulator
VTDQVRKPDGLNGVVFHGNSPASSGTYRAQQSTLVDDDERLSLEVFSSFEKNRALLTFLTGPAKGSVFRVNKEIITLGRSEDADIPLPDPSLSRIHARFLRVGFGRGARYLIEDCGSTNGTFVGGQRLEGPTPILDGVRLGFGRRSLARFAVQDALEEHALLNVHDSAFRDGLTRAYNRRIFDDRLTSEFAYSARHNRPLSLMLLDIDHFKSFNDLHGHQAGDLVLQTVASQITETLRTEDLFCRYGGEEFVILARDTTMVDAAVVAERIRALIAASSITWNGASLGVTVSIGLACNIPVVADADVLVRNADAALYEAKARGRNCVVVTGVAPQKLGLVPPGRAP